MKKELDERLCKEFPNLFADRNGDMMSTCMVWGFEHSDGWFDIIYEAASKIEPLIVAMKKEHPNLEWYPRASQVKEKYGTLRFYMSSETDEMSKIIQEAEDKSEVTCEICGQPGKTRGIGWLSTNCLEHTSKEALESMYEYVCKYKKENDERHEKIMSDLVKSGLIPREALKKITGLSDWSIDSYLEGCKSDNG